MNERRNLPHLTPEERSLPYSDYYYREPAPVPAGTLEVLARGPMNTEDALPFPDINRLLDPGYLAAETGFCILPDGTGYAAMLTDMPGVTGEMLDWWFAWHPLEDLRYKIWYPGAHVANSVEDPERLANIRLPYRERYLRNTNFPIENVGNGMQRLFIRFVPPEEFNLDATRFIRAKVATVICALAGMPSTGLLHTRMIHFVRTTARGVEMRSRFWIGHAIRLGKTGEGSPVNRFLNSRMVKGILINEKLARSMACHCAQEYANLASILPPLYRDYAVS